MRSYTNSDGELIEISQEHLETSINIYEELKKLSPSRRVNWKKHKELMEKAGFFDSDYNERYRCFIKMARKQKGILPSVQKYDTEVKQNMLNAIKSEIGELRMAKIEASEDFKSLNKLVRDTGRDILITEIIKDSIQEMDWSIFEPVDYIPRYTEDKPLQTAIVCISDLHYGFVGETTISEYNTEIAKELMKDYAAKVLAMLEKENVDKILVLNLGDLVEGDLRNQSLFDTQKTLAKQTVEATDLIIGFLKTLSEFYEVSYTAIAGNHDRLTRNIKENINGNHVMTISNAIVENMAEQTRQFSFRQPSDDYYTFIHSNGVNILAVHGDRTNIKNSSALAEQSTLFGIDFDIVVGGHFHSHNITEVGTDKYIAIFGSIKGSDDFSIKIGKSSTRSQGVILIDTDGNFDIRQIKL